MAVSIVGLVFVGLFAVCVRAVSSSVGAVSRQRVAKFARRQALIITPDNGNLVIAYLATTRRWRAAGLATGVIVSFAWSIDNGLSINMVDLIAGWFVGAVIAEWRIARAPVGTRRAASLQPRVPDVYASGAARAVPFLVTAVAVAVVGVGVVVGMSGRDVPIPQIVTLADVLAADDAIRSRSLRVLVGAIGTLTAYCVVAQLGFLSHAYGGTGPHGSIGLAQVVLWLLGTLFGRAMGTSPWSARRPASAAHVA